MATTTKKQHYVWRKYLAPWTNNGSLDTGKIFVYRKKTRGTQQVIEQRGLMKIGFENYFYDISGFTKKDIRVRWCTCAARQTPGKSPVDLAGSSSHGHHR